MKIYSIINAASPNVNEQENNITAFAVSSGINIENISVIRINGKLENYDSKVVSDTLCEKCSDADLIILPGNDSGNELAIRLALGLGGSGLTGVTQVNLDAGMADKKVYAGNLIGQYKLGDKPWCLAVDRSVNNESLINDRTDINIEIPTNNIDEALCFDKVLEASEQDDDGISNAEFVLACGQGLKKKANVEKLESVAANMNAQIGASRPVAMNAWVPMDRLIGVSGNMIKPKVCITAAVSGSPAFYAGIEKSDTIIAVNIDDKAPIMKQSDIAVKGDAIEVLQQLAELINEGK